MSNLLKKYAKGFTLIEVLVILLVAGLLVAMMFPFFGGMLSRSAAPTFSLQTTLGVHQVMENITAAYNGSGKSADALTILRDQITNGNFTSGPYTATAAFIDLDEDNPRDPVTLRVTITSSTSGEALTALFTAQ